MEGGKAECPEKQKKNLRAGMDTQPVTPDTGNEPGPQRWEVSALITALSLYPQSLFVNRIIDLVLVIKACRLSYRRNRQRLCRFTQPKIDGPDRAANYGRGIKHGHMYKTQTAD